MECIGSLIVGIIGYGLYMALFAANRVPENYIQFNPVEPLVFICSAIAGGLLYLLILTTVYKIEQVHKKRNAAQVC